MSKRSYKPTKQKELEGNRGRRDLSNEPQFYVLKGDTEPPNWLDDIGKERWKYYLGVFEPTGLITIAGYDAFAILMDILATIIRITTYINTENQSLTQEVHKPDPDGGVRKEFKESHWSVMRRQYQGHFRMYAKEFGLTTVGLIGLKVNTGDRKGDDL